MTWSGSERVASRLAHVLNARHAYTFAAKSRLLERVFPSIPVTTSRLGRTKLAQKRWDLFLPLMARWWRSLDVSSYDLVVTCSHSTVNAVRVRTDAFHLSYCCTPMRYAWYWREEMGRVPRSVRWFWPVIAMFLRAADRKRSRNVHAYLAVSQHVQRRIEAAYGRQCEVVYPPVDTAFFTPDPAVPREHFFLYAGRLVPYKGAEAAIRAANDARVPLVVAGSGPQLSHLRALAGPAVTFVTEPTDVDLRDLYRRANALVFPGVEDFGIVMIEAQACGTPVIAYGAGGALEAVQDGVTGELYANPHADHLAHVMRNFDASRYDRAAVRAHAERFSVARFDEAISQAVSRILDRSPL